MCSYTSLLDISTKYLGHKWLLLSINHICPLSTSGTIAASCPIIGYNYSREPGTVY